MAVELADSFKWDTRVMGMFKYRFSCLTANDRNAQLVCAVRERVSRKDLEVPCTAPCTALSETVQLVEEPESLILGRICSRTFKWKPDTMEFFFAACLRPKNYTVK